MSHSNQGGDRPFTPPTSISHFSPNEHPSILSGQGYFLTPASKPLYTSGSTSITQSNHCNLNGLASVHNYGPAYSTPYMSQNATSHTLASSPSPPVLPCPLPMFVNGGKSRYFDYYNPSESL